MNTNDNKSTSRVALEDNSSVVVARRRALLRGVGKGAAVLAATAPLQTLAGQSLLTFDGKHQCSVSGQHSGVHSATPQNTARCGGYSPGWWGQKYNKGAKAGKPKHWPWPDGGNAVGWSLPSGVTYLTKCKFIFSSSTLMTDGATPSPPSLWQIMEPRDAESKFSNTDEFHWVCAWLNALSHSFNFPYTGAQVVAFYDNGKGTTAYEDALTFFKTYMETHTS